MTQYIPGFRVKSAVRPAAERQLAALGVKLSAFSAVFGGDTALTGYDIRKKDIWVDGEGYKPSNEELISGFINYPELMDDTVMSRSEADLLAAYTLHEIGHIKFSPKLGIAISGKFDYAGLLFKCWNGLEDARIENAIIGSGIGGARKMLRRLLVHGVNAIDPGWNPTNINHAPFTLSLLGREAYGNGVPFTAALLERIPEPKRGIYAAAVQSLLECSRTERDIKVLDVAERFLLAWRDVEPSAFPAETPEPSPTFGGEGEPQTSDKYQSEDGADESSAPQDDFADQGGEAQPQRAPSPSAPSLPNIGGERQDSDEGDGEGGLPDEGGDPDSDEDGEGGAGGDSDEPEGDEDDVAGTNASAFGDDDFGDDDGGDEAGGDAPMASGGDDEGDDEPDIDTSAGEMEQPADPLFGSSAGDDASDDDDDGGDAGGSSAASGAGNEPCVDGFSDETAEAGESAASPEIGIGDMLKRVNGRSARGIILPPAPRGVYHDVSKWTFKERTAATEKSAVTKLSRNKFGALKAQMVRLLRAPEISGWDGGMTAGRFDRRRVSRFMAGSEAVFKKRWITEGVNTAVTVLCDLSGSMSGEPARTVANIAYAICDAAESANAVVRVVGFRTGGDYDECYRATDALGYKVVAEGAGHGCSPNMPVFKDYGQKLRDAQVTMTRITQCVNGGTPDYESLRTAVEDIAKRPEPRKVVLVLTDGIGNPAGTSAMSDFANNVLGVDVMGIGVNIHSPEYFRKAYPVGEVGNNLEQLAKVTLKRLNKVLDARLAGRRTM